MPLQLAPRLVHRLGLSLGLALGLAGAVPFLGSCEKAGSDQPASTQAEYHRDIAPVLDRYCTSCHSPGGIAPFALTDYASAQRYASAIRGAVESGVMPPWMPSDAGQPLRYSRKLRPEDRELLLGWIAAGAPEGDPSTPPRTDIPAAEKVALPRPDLTLDPGQSYTPKNSKTDDYHCFVFDPKLSADTFLTAGNITPGNQSIVHHVLLYEILAADAPSVQQQNAGGTGYTCYGGPGATGQPTTLLAWVPGSVPMRVPEGGALRLHKGSLLVMQIHYNVLTTDGRPDRSVAQLEIGSTAPSREMHILPIANPKKLAIAAGDPAAQQVVTYPLSALTLVAGVPIATYEIYGMAPHMHTLGRRIAVSAAGTLLLEIPRWDFHWQQGYQLMTTVVAKPSDQITLECTYDNSAANQPVIDGVPQTPRDVKWGESTSDEMCLSYIMVSQVK